MNFDRLKHYCPLTDAEIEADRLEELQKLHERWEGGEKEVTERFESPIGYSEAYHTAWIAYENFHSYVVTHPVVVRQSDLYLQAYRALEMMMASYQAIACFEPDKELANGLRHSPAGGDQG